MKQQPSRETESHASRDSHRRHQKGWRLFEPSLIFMFLRIANELFSVSTTPSASTPSDLRKCLRRGIRSTDILPYNRGKITRNLHLNSRLMKVSSNLTQMCRNLGSPIFKSPTGLSLIVKTLEPSEDGYTSFQSQFSLQQPVPVNPTTRPS